MQHFPQRGDPTKLLWGRILSCVLIVIVGIAAKGVWSVYEKQEESGIMRVQAEAELAGLQAREIQLRSEISDLKTDRGLEEQMRERYNLVKEGEGVVVIVDPPAQSISPIKSTPLQRMKSMFSL